MTREQAIENLLDLYESEFPNYGLLKECIISLGYDDYYGYGYNYYYGYDYYYHDFDYRHTIICLILASEGVLPV